MKKVRREDVERRKRATYHVPAPRRWEQQILQIIAEQMAVPMDLVAAFMKVERTVAERAMQELLGKEWVKIKQFFVNDEPWVWLTRAGLKQSGTDFNPKELKMSSLPHYRGICEVRLDLEAGYPDGEWVCERKLWRRLSEHHHVPDAVFKVRNAEGKEKLWAIEVERTQKTAARYASVVAHRCAHYQRVFYYCTPQIKRKFDQIPEFKHSKVLVTTFFKEHSEVRNFQWNLLPAPDPTVADRPEEIEPWEAEIVRLLAEQEAMPIDQFARFLKRDLPSAEAVARHLREACLVAQGVGPVDEGSWLWPTNRGARLAESGLKAIPPSLLILRGIRRENEARLFVQELYPQGHWWSRRMLLQGNKGAIVPAGVMREGEKQYAVEIEPKVRSVRSFAKKYEVRYERYTRQGHDLLLLCLPDKVETLETLKRLRGWTKLTVKACPALDPDAKPPEKKAKAAQRKRPQSTIPLAEVAPEDIPAELLHEIEVAEGAPPKVVLAGKRKGKGFPRWRVTTERNVWRVTENPFGWLVKPASEKEREERLDPPYKPKRPNNPPAPEGSIPLREIGVDELPKRVIQEIQAKEGAPPVVRLAAKRTGGGHHRWRVTTDREVWRITFSPWGWKIKRSGPIERVQPLEPPEQPAEDLDEMVQLDLSDLPAKALETVQRAAGSPFPPRAFKAWKHSGSGAPRFRIETDMGAWRLTAVGGRWKATRV